MTTGAVQALARALVKLVQHPALRAATANPPLALSHISPTEARIVCLARGTSEPYPPLSWRYFGGLVLVLAGLTGGLVVLAAVSNLHPVLHTCRFG